MSNEADRVGKEATRLVAKVDKMRTERAPLGGTTNGIHRPTPGVLEGGWNGGTSGQRTIMKDRRSDVGDLSGGESAGRVPASEPMSDRGPVHHPGKGK